MNHEPIDRAAYERGLALLLASRIPARIVERYGQIYCRQCDHAIQYCKCSPAENVASADGDSSDLVQRVRQARYTWGGR